MRVAPDRLPRASHANEYIDPIPGARAPGFILPPVSRAAQANFKHTLSDLFHDFAHHNNNCRLKPVLKTSIFLFEYRLQPAIFAAVPVVFNLPVDDRSVVRVELGFVWPRFADLGHQLVFVNGDPETRIGQQWTVTVGDGRERFGEQVVMLVVAALLN